MGRYTSGGVGRDVAAGAIAGAAAVFLISKLDWPLSHAGAAPKEGAPSTGPDPAHAIADKAAAKAGATDVGQNARHAIGHTVHYGVGIGIGALYGLLRGFAPSVTAGRGALYGLGAFIAADEIGAPALGLAKSPFDYPARDHARAALAHGVFGVATDLVTRILSPWRSELIVYRGPTIAERLDEGREAFGSFRDNAYARGRHYLDQGREAASDATGALRERLSELDVEGLADRGRRRVRGWADRARSYLPEQDELEEIAESGRKQARRFYGRVRDDVEGYADRGRKQARQMAARVQEQLPDRGDLEEYAEQGRKRAGLFARNVRDRLPDRDDLEDYAGRGRKRAGLFARRVRDQLPGRDDLDDYAEQGRKHARRLAKRLPDRDDVEDAIADGRKRLGRLTAETRRAAEDAGGPPVARALRWLFG